MKWFAAIFILHFSLSAMAGGTRGGGDFCEREFKTHLILALQWLRGDDHWSIGHGLLSNEEREKASAVLLKTGVNGQLTFPNSVEIECVNHDLEIAQKKKSAISEKIDETHFKTLVQAELWASSADRPTARTGIALHEILVMAAIEATDDYHISQNLIDYGRLPLRRLSCSSEYDIWTQHFTLSLESAADKSGYYIGKLVFDIRDDKYHARPTDHLEFVFSHQLLCHFSEKEPRIFSCFENHDGRTISVIESVFTVDGQRLDIAWNKLLSPVVKYGDLMKTLIAHGMVSGRFGGEPGTFSFLFGESSGNADSGPVCRTEVGEESLFGLSY
jgi:hypothetical protein